MIKNRKQVVIGFITLVLVTAVIITSILLLDSIGNETKNGELYVFPITAGTDSYMISVFSNYSSPPEVSFGEKGNIISIDFRGNPENSFFNVTVPTALIDGKISLIDKYYEVSEEYFIQSFNGTHNSIYFTFDHPAYVKHFEIRGT